MPKENSKSDFADRQRVLRAKIGDIVFDSGRYQFQGYRVRVVAKAGERTEFRAAWFRDMVIDGIQSDAEVEESDDEHR